MEIVKKANPESVDAIHRDFCPVEYRDMDLSAVECFTLGLGHLKGSHRVAVVYAVDRNDANKLVHLAKVLGPATGGSMVSVPCGGEVEWAQVEDCLLWRAEELQKRAADKAIRVTELQRAINKQLPDIADNMEKQKVGRSSFGYGGHLQRIAT